MTGSPLRSRLSGWVRRYLPSEIIGTAASLISAWLTWEASGSLVITAVVATIAETVGFYSIFVVKAVVGFRRSERGRDGGAVRRTALVAMLTVRALLLEFGPAELIDTLVVRPLLLVVIPAWLGPGPVSWMLAKLAADVVFYVVAVLSLEGARPLIVPEARQARPRARHRLSRGVTL